MMKVKLRGYLKIVTPQTAKDTVIFLFMSKEKNLIKFDGKRILDQLSYHTILLLKVL